MKIAAFKAVLLVLILAASSCGRKLPLTLPIETALPAPAGFTVIQRYSPRHIDISWQYPENLKDAMEGFVVYRNNGIEKTVISTTPDVVFQDVGVDQDSTYTYSVAAIGIDGTLSPETEAMEIKPVYYLDMPEGVGFEISAENTSLRWKMRSSISIYNIYSGRIGAWVRINGMPHSQGRLAVPHALLNSASYIIREASTDGGYLSEGPESESIEIKPSDYVPGSPAGLQAVANENIVLLFWQENPEAWIDGYKVYRADGKGDFYEISTTAQPVYRDGGCPKASICRYRVTASGPVSEGRPSNEAMVEMP